MLQQPAANGAQQGRLGRIQAAGADGDERCSRCRGDPFELIRRISRALLESNVERCHRYASPHCAPRRSVAELCEEIAYRVRIDARYPAQRRREVEVPHRPLREVSHGEWAAAGGKMHA